MAATLAEPPRTAQSRPPLARTRSTARTAPFSVLPHALRAPGVFPRRTPPCRPVAVFLTARAPRLEPAIGVHYGRGVARHRHWPRRRAYGRCPVRVAGQPPPAMSDRPRRRAPASPAAVGDAGRAGGIVALPTETVYGLAADATDPAAVAAHLRRQGPARVQSPDRPRRRSCRGRRRWSWLNATALAPRRDMLLARAADARPDQRARSNGIAAAVSAGLPTLAVRVPAHPVMQAVLREASAGPLAAPSANASGTISPTTAKPMSRPAWVTAVPLIVDAGRDAGRPREHDRRGRRRPASRCSAPAAFAAADARRQRCRRTTRSPRRASSTSHYAPRQPVRLDAIAARARTSS